MKLERTARFLYPRLRHWAETRPHHKTGVPGQPDFEVAPGGEVYLQRFVVVKPTTSHPGVYLHRMLRDDDDVCHDHPYWSWSLCLNGGLRENYTEEPEDEEWAQSHGTYCGAPRYVRCLEAGDIVFRSARLAHQLCVEPGREPWTLFIPGPRQPNKRGEGWDWGFWCPRGWKHYKLYTKGTQHTGTSARGEGCGEII